jgi:hypothetical protein
MNIFFCHACPYKSARTQCDKHVAKMALEGMQMMYTAHHCCGNVEAWNGCALKIYKATHANHPMAIWVRAAVAHYLWMYAHVWALLDEYMLRYGRIHACAQHMARMSTVPARVPPVPDPVALSRLPRLCLINAPRGCIAAPACIEENARHECLVYKYGYIDLVQSYRRYYEWKRRTGKVDMRWSRRAHRRRWKRVVHWVCLVAWLQRRVRRQFWAHGECKRRRIAYRQA